MKSMWTNLINDESGQGLTEYALIIALVAVGLILVLTAFRDVLGGVYNQATNELNTAKTGQVPAT
jgi:pilus assembly protein Flp/PilA